jgi:hypothetical protein
MDETLRKQLSPLIALLSSDRDGEVLATVRAIGRRLLAANCDFIDFAHWVENGPKPEVKYVFVEDDKPELQQVVDFCWVHVGRLKEKEAEFIESCFDRIAQGRELSEKQLNWLNAIYKKLELLVKA